MTFNRDQFRSLIEGDRDLFSSLLELFEADWEGLIEVIRQSIDSGDGKALEQAAHRLKGNLRNFYASSAAEIAQSLESSGNSGSFGNKQDLKKMADDLREEIKRLLIELHQFLNEMA